MSSKKPVTVRRAGRWLAPALAVLVLGGCGAVKVQPTSSAGSSKLVSRGKVDSPLTDTRNHLKCLRDDHLAVQKLSPTKLQIGDPPSGPTVVFTPTPGAAQAEQIEGQAQGAEVIGSALLYTNAAPDSELGKVEDCLTQGVTG